MDKIIFEFKVLHIGWECDEDGYVKERENGNRYIELTQHGMPYEAQPGELEEKILEYEDAIRNTFKAIHLLKNS